MAKWLSKALAGAIVVLRLSLEQIYSKNILVGRFYHIDKSNVEVG